MCEDLTIARRTIVQYNNASPSSQTTLAAPPTPAAAAPSAPETGTAARRRGASRTDAWPSVTRMVSRSLRMRERVKQVGKVRSHQLLIHPSLQPAARTPTASRATTAPTAPVPPTSSARPSAEAGATRSARSTRTAASTRPASSSAARIPATCPPSPAGIAPTARSGTTSPSARVREVSWMTMMI